MEEKPIRYETQEVKTLRGLEAKSIEKMEQDGWELVSQDKGKLRTTLNFRRPKRPLPKNLIIVGSAAAIILATVVTIGAITEDKHSVNPTPKETATEEVVKTPTPTPSADQDQILTVENNKDLATILLPKSEDSSLWQAFYDKYKGRTIEFDANVADMRLLGDSQYTYTVLFYPGNYSDVTAYGPPMRDQRVVIPYDWHRKNPDDVIVYKSNIRLVAKIVDYNSDTSVFDINIEGTSERK